MSSLTPYKDQFNQHFAITPHDTNNIPQGECVVHCGAAGNISVVDDHGTALTYTSVPAHFRIPVVVSRVNATGTTVTPVIGLK